eukprot:2846611-Amphidinium_carterae.1
MPEHPKSLLVNGSFAYNGITLELGTPVPSRMYYFWTLSTWLAKFDVLFPFVLHRLRLKLLSLQPVMVGISGSQPDMHLRRCPHCSPNVSYRQTKNFPLTIPKGIVSTCPRQNRNAQKP